MTRRGPALSRKEVARVGGLSAWAYQREKMLRHLKERARPAFEASFLNDQEMRLHMMFVAKRRTDLCPHCRRRRGGNGERPGAPDA